MDKAPKVAQAPVAQPVQYAQTPVQTTVTATPVQPVQYAQPSVPVQPAQSTAADECPF